MTLTLTSFDGILGLFSLVVTIGFIVVRNILESVGILCLTATLYNLINFLCVNVNINNTYFY